MIDGTRVVLFGGGATLYMLDASDGRLLDSSCFDPHTTNRCAGTTGETIEIESSPAIVHLAGGETREVVGMDFNEDVGVGRAGLVELRIVHDATGRHVVPRGKVGPGPLRA